MSDPAQKPGGAGRAARPPTPGRLRRPGAASQRLSRTILLGALAVVFGIAWLARELGLDRDELLDYLTTSLVLVGGLVTLALIGGALIWLFRWFRRRG